MRSSREGRDLLTADLRPPPELLAPPPDFQYIGLSAPPREAVGYMAAFLGASASFGAGWSCGMGGRGAALLAAVTAGVSLLVRREVGAKVAPRFSARGVPMAIVPWGILFSPEERSRIVRWAGVEKIAVRTVYGTDAGTPTTRFSIVTVETSRERLSGRAPGAVPLDRLALHLTAYAREAAHAMALDFDGVTSAEGPLEAEFGPLLAAARGYLVGAQAALRLGLPAGGYRNASAQAVSEDAVAELSSVLRDRAAKPIDPRGFAAVLAAELRAEALTADLLALGQSPHPLLAAVAKTAARKLGASAQAGTLDEVLPFLHPSDVDALERWGGE